jgi:NAD(P)-dependent dehydrogenase (short-subunit alcohol dehydrogenase family)
MRRASRRTPGEARAVVVTGASSGIGAATAVLLHRSGFRVYAGVRDEDAAQRCRAEGLVPLRLDITRPDLIGRARRQLDDELAGRGLYGLVNNAGAVIPGPLEYLSPERLRAQLEVNLVGHLAVTQQLLDLLRPARGRIVNVGSISGRMTSPFIGGYSAAKHAVEGLSDALRLELRPWGVRVVVVQPGAIATSMPEKLLRDVDLACAGLPPAGQQRYGTALRRFGRTLSDNHRRHGSPPEVVARAILVALTERTPRARYPVGAQSGLLRIRWAVPDRVLDWAVQRLTDLHRPGDLTAQDPERDGLTR